YLICIIFFQAEDGIRDFHVTGVQTCALPIFAIFISNSGATIEILDALEIAQKNKAKCIAITKYTKSELAEKADIVLSISTPEVTIRSGAMGSRIAMLTVIDILFAGVASAEYEHVKVHLKKTRNILNKKHRRSIDNHRR